MATDMTRSLTSRILHEHRRAIAALAILLGVNAVVYALLVYPLAERVANIQQRDAAAERALTAAQADHARATGTLTGQDRASAQLMTFYERVLPADLASARRLTHLRLPQLARQSRLRFERSAYEPVSERGSTLTRLKTEMTLTGSYQDVRSFIHQLEASPEFVVIDDIFLAEEDAESGMLAVRLQLSTYFREAPRD
jgi:Tfp pilus assembly protein PilO